MTESRMAAMGGAIGSYVLFVMLWHPLVAGVYYAVNGKLAGLKAPGWYFFLLRLNPLEVYAETASSISDQFIYGLFGWQGTVENIPKSALQDTSNLMQSNRLGGHVPFYLSDWFAPVILLLWIVVPAVIGYRKFQRADLN
jgi:ABC-2 type transport system permease protein